MINGRLRETTYPAVTIDDVVEKTRDLRRRLVCSVEGGKGEG